MAENTVVPHAEELRRALRWIATCREEDPGARLVDLISEAGARFNLGPREQDSLLRLLAEDQGRAQE